MNQYKIKYNFKLNNKKKKFNNININIVTDVNSCRLFFIHIFLVLKPSHNNLIFNFWSMVFN